MLRECASRHENPWVRYRALSRDHGLMRAGSARDLDQLSANGGAARNWAGRGQSADGPVGACVLPANCGQATLASNSLEGRWGSRPSIRSAKIYLAIGQ